MKSRLDLPPRLRELDSQIEAVELELRHIIAQTLNDDPASLPTHVQQKINERLQQAARKNPALDLEAYEALAGKLEYADLRELQDTIVTKALWDQFETRFGGKEQVASRFGQLTELRNSIRHSRSVTDIVRKDGEAALLWFKQVLT